MGTALTEISGGVAVLTLSRPEDRNVSSPEMFNELRQAIDAAWGGENVRCVIPVLLASVQVVGEIACCA
jgi:enoyl-CoA hydratase/carnithine racemase